MGCESIAPQPASGFARVQMVAQTKRLLGGIYPCSFGVASKSLGLRRIIWHCSYNSLKRCDYGRNATLVGTDPRVSAG